MHQYIQYRMQCENQHLFYRKKCSINSIYIIYGIKKPTNLLSYTCNWQKSCNRPCNLNPIISFEKNCAFTTLKKIG